MRRSTEEEIRQTILGVVDDNPPMDISDLEMKVYMQMLSNGFPHYRLSTVDIWEVMREMLGR